MKHFFKLLHMEIHRFRYVLLGLMAFAAIAQIIAVVSATSRELAKPMAIPTKAMDDLDVSTYPDPTFSFAWILRQNQDWFIVSILLCIAALVLYVFLIWYRDWFGRSTFIYRLLMLPKSRVHLYFAKLTAILLFVFSMLAWQLLLLVAEEGIFNAIVPEHRIAASYYSDLIYANEALRMLLPISIDDFILAYGAGTIAVLAVFTMILIERSFRKLGVLYGILYGAFCATILLYPVFTFLGNDYTRLYPAEMYALIAAAFAVVAGISIWLSIYLLKKRISV